MGQETSVPQDEVVDDNDSSSSSSSSDGYSTEGSESGSESLNNDEMNKDEESEEKKSDEDKDTNEPSSTPTKPKERTGEESNAPSKELSNERIDKSAPAPQDAPIALINEDQAYYFSINKFTNAQLEDRLSQLSLSRKSILSVSKQQRAHVTLYRQEGATPQELEAMELHTNAAVRILGLSPELRSLRFCLVPGKLSEGKFWGSVFWVLQHGNAVPSGGGGGVVNGDTAPSSSKSKGVERSTSVTSDASDVTTTAEDLQRLLRRKDVELVHLRKQLEESKLALAQLKEQQMQNGTSTNGTNNDKNTTIYKHKGKWIMDQDCVDFLALDEELKANLRREKNKKLNEVRSQMKFILETDDYNDTTGKWDCCGKTSYGVDCGA